MEVTLPRDAVQEPEQARVIANGITSADADGGHSAVKRKYSCEHKIETYVFVVCRVLVWERRR